MIKLIKSLFLNERVGALFLYIGLIFEVRVAVIYVPAHNCYIQITSAIYKNTRHASYFCDLEKYKTRLLLQVTPTTSHASRFRKVQDTHLTTSYAYYKSRLRLSGRRRILLSATDYRNGSAIIVVYIHTPPDGIVYPILHWNFSSR